MANNKLTIGDTHHGGVHASSLTGRYKVRWSEHQAFRELLQNMLDGIADTRGVELNEIEGAVCPDDSNRWVFKVHGEEAGFIQCGKDDEVVLMQKDCSLCSSTLYLGSDKDSTKFAGGFGEGYKVGILVLLKKGLQVQYAMEKETWGFEIDSSPIQQMLVRATPAPANTPPDLVITIRGPGAGKLFQPWRLMAFRHAAERFAGVVIRPAGIPVPKGPDSPCASREHHRLVDGSDADPASHAGLVFAQGISIFQHRVLRALGIDLVLPRRVRLSRDRNDIVDDDGECSLEELIENGVQGFASDSSETAKYVAARCRESQLVAAYVFSCDKEELESEVTCAMAALDGHEDADENDIVFDNSNWTEQQRSELRRHGYVVVEGGPFIPMKKLRPFADLLDERIRKQIAIDAPDALPTASHKAAYQDVINITGLIQRVHAKFHNTQQNAACTMKPHVFMGLVNQVEVTNTWYGGISVSIDVDMLGYGRCDFFYYNIARAMAYALPLMARAVIAICTSAQADPDGFHQVSDQGLDVFACPVSADQPGAGGQAGAKRSAEDAFTDSADNVDGAFSIAPVHFYRAQKFAARVRRIKPAATFLPVMCKKGVMIYAASLATLPDVDSLAARALQYHADIVQFMAPEPVPSYRFAYVPGTKPGFFHNAMMYLNLAALSSVHEAVNLIRFARDAMRWKKSTGGNDDIFLQCALSNMV